MADPLAGLYWRWTGGHLVHYARAHLAKRNRRHCPVDPHLWHRGLSHQHWVIFVSVGGYGFCLGHLLTFIAQHPGDPAYVFIIPGRSRKDFALDIPPRTRSQKNVFRDSLALSFRDSQLQPTDNTAYRFGEGKITEKVVLTPENITEKLQYIAATCSQ